MSNGKKNCVDTFINLSKFGISERRTYLKSLYDYYNGVIDEEDYNYVLKPYGKTRRISRQSYVTTQSLNL